MNKMKSKLGRLAIFCVLLNCSVLVSANNAGLTDVPSSQLPSEQTYEELNSAPMSQEGRAGRAGPPVGPPIGGETPIGNPSLLALAIIALAYAAQKKRRAVTR